MTRKSANLPPKLAAVLARLATQNGGSLTIAQAAVLPYLVDVVAMRVLGRPITGATHVCIADEEWESVTGGAK
jgi:hypothetical protein